MISVIVPIYNVEDYLEDCLVSILNSTYEDFELILVDDGSTDNSGNICDCFQEKDHRIKVFHTENRGLSMARNIGLDCAKGDFISFIDADDVIHPQMLETLINALVSGEYDFSMVDFKAIQKEEQKTAQIGSVNLVDSDFQEITQEAFMRGLLDTSFSALKFNFVWNKLYRRSVIEGMRFATTPIEDLEWNCRVCMRMKNSVFVSRELYYWIQRGSSIVHQGIGERYINRVKSYLLCYKDIPQNFTEFRNRWLERIYKVMLYTRHEVKSQNKELLSRSNTICKAVYRETKDDLMKSELGWAKKLVLLLCYRFPLLYSLMRKCY